MKIVTDKDVYESSRSRDLIELECFACKKIFTKEKRVIKHCLKNPGGRVMKYCTHKCYWEVNPRRNKVEVSCEQCGKKVIKVAAETKRNNHSFCGRSCASRYHVQNKKTGYRRSKLELYIENKLSILYPKLEILYCNRDTIKAELDIYIPSLKLAFELNGIFHYEPIFGEKLLLATQNNDNRKILACAERGIELCVIDSTGLKYFKDSNAEKYLKIVLDIIEQKIVRLKQL